MKKRKIGQGCVNITPLEREYVNQALDANRLSAGPFTKRFETQFAAGHGCKHAVVLNSGTSALHVSLAVLKDFGSWADRDEVLVPASTFIATSNVVIHNNLVPVFVDIDSQTYNINPNEIEKHVTQRTRAIIPVHMYGQPCDMDEIMDVAKRYDLKVVEDSCECMFARFKGQWVGSFGDLGCFSTYVAHILTTGVGGLITTSSDDYAEACRSTMAHGRDGIYLRIDDDDCEDDLQRLRVVVSRRFSFVRLGHSFRSTELEAALGLGQLAIAEEIIAARRRNGARLTEMLGHLTERLQLPVIGPGREHSFMMYPIVCRGDVNRKELVEYLEERGVETRYMMPLLSQPIYKRLFGEDLESKYPVAQWVTANGFYLPCHHRLSGEDLEYMVEAVNGFFHRRG